LNLELLVTPPTFTGARWGYGSCILCWCHWHGVHGVGEAGKLSLPGPLLRLRGPSLLDHRRHGVQSWWSPFRTPTSMRLTNCFLLISFLVPEQKGEEGTKKRESEKEKKKIGGNTRILKVLPLFPEPWLSRTGLLPLLH
jgi:hypothetical protein